MSAAGIVDVPGAIEADPFGIESIYFDEDGEILSVCDSRQTRQTDVEALHGYLCFSYVPTPHTLFSGISRLPVGARLVSGRMHESETWTEHPPHALSECEAVKVLQELLRASVQRMLASETKVGVYLSGGLDSSLIAAMLVENGVRPDLFTLDFGPPWDAELPMAHAVADHLQLPLNVVPAGSKQVLRALEPAARAMEQPFGDGVTVPLFLLGEAASRLCKVVFNGEGGDQLFGGWTNKPLIAAALYGGDSFDLDSAYLETFHRFWGSMDRLYTPEASARTAHVDAGAWIRPALQAPGFQSLLHRLRAANLRLKGAQNIAPRMRQLATCHGLQVRAPFFDKDLTKWSFGLPTDWLLRGSCEKHLLKRVAENYLPQEIVWREKRGMGVPVTEWCLGSLKREAAGRLSPKRLNRDGWFDVEYVSNLRSGKDPAEDFRRRRVGEKLWSLLMLHVWADVHGVNLRL